MRIQLLLLSLIALPLTASCTQAPAEISLKGQQAYGRGSVNETSVISHGSSGYPASSYGNSGYVTPPDIAQSTEQSAKVDAIGISDLSPPNKVAPVHTAPAMSKSLTASSPAGSVNPWTNKPRPPETGSVTEPDSLDKPTQPVAQLDTIINSDKPAKTPFADNAAHSAPAKADVATPGTAVAQNTADKPAASAAAFIWPVAERNVLSGFGPKGGGKINDGVNIAAGEGEPVWAAGTGEVVYAGNEIKGYGNMVLIKHAGNKTTAYAHLGRISVDKYARVKQGDIIGYVGATGNVKEPQLHFVVRDGKEPVDPEKFITKG